jgi:predicted alpha/beta hydrolase family esterase
MELFADALSRHGIHCVEVTERSHVTKDHGDIADYRAALEGLHEEIRAEDQVVVFVGLSLGCVRAISAAGDFRRAHPERQIVGVLISPADDSMRSQRVDSNPSAVRFIMRLKRVCAPWLPSDLVDLISDEIIEREEPESRSAAFGTGSAWLMVFCRDDPLTRESQRRRLRALADAAGMRLVELASGGHGGIFNFCRSEAADYVVDFTLEVLSGSRDRG